MLASVQFDTAARSVPDGEDRYVTKATVYLLNDPSALNSGNGVRRDDAFAWDQDGNRVLVAQGDPVLVGSTWRVECLVSQ